MHHDKDVSFHNPKHSQAIPYIGLLVGRSQAGAKNFSCHKMNKQMFRCYA